MNIYIKTSDGQHKIIQASDLNRSSLPLVGYCITSNVAQCYCFHEVNNVLCRSPIRLLDGKRSVLGQYQSYQQDQDNFSLTPQSFGEKERPSIPSDSQYFSENEIKQLQESIKKAEYVPTEKKENFIYLDGSELSKEQQEKLYFGIVTSTPEGMSFSEYLKKNVLSLENPDKVLQASISSQAIELNDDEKSELNAFRYEFLAPNRIAAFSKAVLYPDETDYHPTVGDVLDFYSHCVQATLETLKKPIVPRDQVRTYTEATRTIKLGQSSYDFKDDGIYNQQGLIGPHEVIFRCVMLLFQLQPQDINHETIKNIFNHADFKPIHYKLYHVLNDLILSIKEKKETSLAEYVDVYSSIIASYSKTDWINFSDNLKTAKTVLLEMMPASEFIQHDNRISMEEKNEILKNIESWGGITFSLVEPIILLQKAHLLTQDNFNAIKARSNPQVVASALLRLQEAHILNQANFDAIKVHSNPRAVADALLRLQEAHILNQDNRNAITVHSNPWQVEDVLCTLHKADLLNQDNFNAIKAHRDPWTVASVLCALHKADLLNQDNRNAITAHHDPWQVAEALRTLHKADLLNQDNRNAITTAHSNPQAVAKALLRLQEAHILNQDNRNAITAHCDPWQVAKALLRLQEAHILNQDNFDAIQLRNNPEIVANKLIKLHQQKNTTNSASLFVSKSPSVVAVAYLKSVYQEKGGASDIAHDLFNSCDSYQIAIKKLQDKYQEEGATGNGAIYKTLLEVNALPSKLSNTPQPKE